MAKQAKIVKLKKLESCSSLGSSSFLSNNSYEDELDSSELAYINDISDRYATISNKKKQFKKIFDTKSIGSNEQLDVVGVFLTKLFIIKDYRGVLTYGDLNVNKGDHVYLISESEYFCFVENEHGVQGFVPKDICIDLEATVRRAQTNMRQTLHYKVTSL